ncbi:vWA domain-containing protein [Nocardioides silvaticus]|uniref:vWA domain-containing protein n=1 Tax=Nocardioides silvaticus TaxID=2201891 RepID=UPI0011B1CA3A|nr:VWA domain-containing protein [Nocardioides silvaticus]
MAAPVAVVCGGRGGGSERLDHRRCAGQGQLVSRRPLAVLVSTLIAGSLLSISSPGVHATATLAETDEGAVQRFGSCLAGGGEGHVLLVLDTSRSLQETDPEGQRVEAATYLMQELGAFQEQTDAKLDVAIAGFSDDFAPSFDWTPLERETTGQVLDAVTEIGARDDGFETDYWSAVTGARKELADHAGPDDCSALVWLSDGMYDLDKRDSDSEEKAYGTTKPYGPQVTLETDGNVDQVQAAGETDLCRDGGVADALRAQGVVTLAIGLQGGQPSTAFDLMRGIATGAEVEGEPCGAQDGRQAGKFVLAGAIGDLFFAFDEFADPDRAPISQSTPLCQGSLCPEGTHQFVLDASISEVRILGGTNLEQYYAVLQSPTGARVRIDPGARLDASGPAFESEGRWVSDSVFSMRLSRTRDRGWVGAWRITFVDPGSTGAGSARSNIRLYGDVRPAWLDAEGAELTAGEVVPIRLGLARADGSRLDPSVLKGTVSVDAELRYPDGSTVPIASDLDATELGTPASLDLTGAPAGDAVVHLTLSQTTAPAGEIHGTTLEPQAVDHRVAVLPPPDYPTLPGTVDFGEGESADAVTAVLPLTGEGCVWLDRAEAVTLPDGVAAAPVTADASKPSDCRSGELTLTLTPDATGSGLVSGELHIMTRSDRESAEPVATTVAYRYEMLRPPEGRAWWFLLLVALGLMLPLLLLMAVKWWTSRIPGSSLTTLAERGVVSGNSSFLNGWRPDPTRLRVQSLETGDRRRVVVSDRTTLVAKTDLLRLTEAGYVVATGGPFASSAGKRLPLSVQDHWVAVLDPQDLHRGPVEVVFLLSSGARRLDVLVSDARGKVPTAVADLRRGFPDTAAPENRDGFERSVAPGSDQSTTRTRDDSW